MFVRRAMVNSARTAVQVSRRGMAGGHHHAPPATGVEGALRKFFPQDHQMAMAIMGAYISLVFISKLFGGSKKKEQPAVTASAGGSSGDIPSIESPEFGTWIENEKNLELLINSIEK